jgi:hypothetical protein
MYTNRQKSYKNRLFKKKTPCIIVTSTKKNDDYREISIDRPGGIHSFETHNFLIIHKRTKIKPYSERVETFHSEYAFIIVLWQLFQKLCFEKKWKPPGLSIEF